MIQLSIALTVGLCLASAICHPGIYLWQVKWNKKEIKLVDCFAF